MKMLHWAPCALLAFICAWPAAAQNAFVPDAPFTPEDARRGLQLAQTSWEIRQQIGDFRGQAAPFKIMGNLYFVGVGNGEVYLLTSPQGHILFGAGFKETGQQVEKNIQAMGFRLTDIKVILLNHHHGDQSGAAAYLKAKTGAQVMAGFAEVPYLEKAIVTPLATTPPPPPDVSRLTVFSLFPSSQFFNISDYPAVHVDRALFDGDVINVGPLKVTAYLAPGHTTSSTSFLYTVRDAGRDYRVFEWCCWEFPDDYSRNPAINEASVKHTFATWAKVLPIDIYLETGAYSWSGLLNQPSGTFQERLARLKVNPQLWVNRDVFSGLSAARQVSFKENIAKLKAGNQSAPASAPDNSTKMEAGK